MCEGDIKKAYTALIMLYPAFCVFDFTTSVAFLHGTCVCACALIIS